MNLLYRSLSLDHILLGLDGHIKLVDFSVSKIDLPPEGKTNSFCGTAEFMPPEVSGTTGHYLFLLMRIVTDDTEKDAFRSSV